MNNQNLNEYQIALLAQLANGAIKYTTLSADDKNIAGDDDYVGVMHVSLEQMLALNGLEKRGLIVIALLPGTKLYQAELMPTELSAVITPGEAMTVYGLAEATVRQAINRGQIPARKSGGTWLIRRTDADARWGQPKTHKLGDSIAIDLDQDITNIRFEFDELKPQLAGALLDAATALVTATIGQCEAAKTRGYDAYNRAVVAGNTAMTRAVDAGWSEPAAKTRALSETIKTAAYHAKITINKP